MKVKTACSQTDVLESHHSLPHWSRPTERDQGEPGNEATPLVALRADSSIIQIGAKQKEHDSNWENEKWV